MHRAVVVFAVLGCGRINFDPPGAPTFACTPADETCNAIDDDCDGLVDEGCPCMPLDVMHGAPSIIIDHPSFAFDGTTYRELYTDSAGIQLATFEVDGTYNLIGLAAPGYTAPDTRHGVFVATDVLLTPLESSSALELVRFGLGGALLGTTTITPASTGPYSPQVLAGDAGVVVVWADGRAGSDDLYLAPFSVDGTRVGPDMRVTDGHASPQSPKIVRVPDGYAMLWLDFHDAVQHIHFAHVDPTAGTVDVLDVAGMQSLSGADLAWAGQDYVLAWSGGQSIEIRALDWSYATRFDVLDEPVDAIVFPVLASTGTAVAQARASRPPSTVEFELTHVSFDGELGQPATLSSTTGSMYAYGEATIYADASREVVAYVLSVGGAPATNYLHVRCP